MGIWVPRYGHQVKQLRGAVGRPFGRVGWRWREQICALMGSDASLCNATPAGKDSTCCCSVHLPGSGCFLDSASIVRNMGSIVFGRKRCSFPVAGDICVHCSYLSARPGTCLTLNTCLLNKRRNRRRESLTTEAPAKGTRDQDGLAMDIGSRGWASELWLWREVCSAEGLMVVELTSWKARTQWWWKLPLLPPRKAPSLPLQPDRLAVNHSTGDSLLSHW